MTGPVGYAPHVPNAIAGRPYSMIYQKRIVEQQPSINIFVNFKASAKFTKEQIEQTAINIFSVLQDTKINLCVGVTSHTRKSKRAKEATSRVMLVVKLSNESMPQKFFATAHPSMLRRLYFRWLETVPGLKHKKYIENYGYVGNFSQTDLKDYAGFKSILEGFQKRYKLEAFSLKQIDQYIWQLGKEFFPKKY